MKQLTVLLAALALLSACETFAGFGRDLQKGGSNVQDAAQSVEKKL